MADKNRRQYFLTLTRPQLIALATQKGVAPYRDARAKTKGQLVALLCDVEGVLTPVKTWAPADADPVDDDDQRVIIDFEASTLVTIEEPSSVPADGAPRHDDTGLQYRRPEYLI